MSGTISFVGVAVIVAVWMPVDLGSNGAKVGTVSSILISVGAG